MFLDAVTETVGNRVIVNVGEAVNVNELPGLAPNQQKIAGAYRELQENDINVPLTSKLYRYSASSPAVREALSELSGTIYASELASRSVGKTVSNMFARIKNVGKKTESAANEFWNERDFYQVAQGYGADIYKPRTPSPSEDKTVKTAFATGDAKGGIWTQPYGGQAKVKSDISAGMASSRTSLYGVQGGADAFVGGGKILLGGALAFGHGHAKQGNAKIDVNDYRFGGYAGTEIGKIGLRGSASVGYQDYDGERGLSLYGITASSDYSGYNVNLSFDGDVKLYENDGLALRLIFGAEMTYERTRSFTESGAAGLSLVVDGDDNTLFNAKAGFGIAKHTDTYGIEADLYYRNLLVGYDRDMTARFAGGGSVFKLDGYDYDRNVGGLELSFYVKATDNLCFTPTRRQRYRKTPNRFSEPSASDIVFNDDINRFGKKQI